MVGCDVGNEVGEFDGAWVKGEAVVSDSIGAWVKGEAVVSDSIEKPSGLVECSSDNPNSDSNSDSTLGDAGARVEAGGWNVDGASDCGAKAGKLPEMSGGASGGVAAPNTGDVAAPNAGGVAAPNTGGGTDIEGIGADSAGRGGRNPTSLLAPSAEAEAL
jgi:hypothetical protein